MSRKRRKMKRDKQIVMEFASLIINCIRHETFRKGYELKKVERRIKEIAKAYYDVDIVTEQVIIPHD